MAKVLEVNNLTVKIGEKSVIDNASFALFSGEVLALVGESGSGKTLTALSVLNLLPEVAVVEKGSILFEGENIFDLDKNQLRNLRGNRIGMVFQEPFTALNPVLNIGVQISETIAAHLKMSAGEINKRVRELLDMVKLSPEVLSKYPHELSGGMRQRVILAMALSCDPDVLILDEPTTALDVSIQKEVLDLIKQIKSDINFAILFITHDLSIVNLMADNVCVMKRGVIVETGSVENVLHAPRHEYTQHLIGCIPRLGDERKRLPA
ncbi:MAG: ABC transporter ATP-binding protein [Candidatus Omnitrophica bacterium]|nr:ABC transporter ATP-binding protein [Candidatus Omnitrophota bacterium]